MARVVEDIADRALSSVAGVHYLHLESSSESSARHRNSILKQLFDLFDAIMRKTHKKPADAGREVVKILNHGAVRSTQ